MASSETDSGAPVTGWRPAVYFTRLTDALSSTGSFWIFCLTFLICADVVARNAFNHPINGVAEMVGYSVVAAIYLQLASTIRAGRFTRAEVLIASLEANRPVAAAMFNAVFSLIGVLVFFGIAVGSWHKLVEAWPNLRFGNAESFSILVWPLRAIVLVGSALAALEFLMQAAGHVRSLAHALASRRRESPPVGWPAIAMLVAVAGLIAIAAASGLGRVEVGALSLVGILVLVCLGIHIANVLIVLGFVGIWIMMGDTRIAQNVLKLASNEFLRNYVFGVIPLFVLMGLLVNSSGMGKDIFDVARWIMRPIRGGLGVATVGANAVFAAITGSSIASAAVFTKVATPHMLNHGYSPRFAVGTVAGSSVLGMLIPPSLLLIVYAFVAEQSVGLLFLAAMVPGLILAAAMGAMIVAMAHLWPDFVGTPDVDDVAEEDPVSAARKLLPIALLVGAVLGGIYGGYVTPVEAGAVGSMGAFLIALIRRSLTLKGLWNVMVETGQISVSIMFLILAANVYGRMLALSGLPQEMGNLITALDLGFYGFIAIYMAVLIVLGMFLDSVSIMLIILPLVLSVVQAFGADLIWFGIVTVIVVEMGLLTPPLGLSCYVVKSVLEDDTVSLNDIFVGALPYVLIMLAVAILLVAVPEICLLFV